MRSWFLLRLAHTPSSCEARQLAWCLEFCLNDGVYSGVSVWFSRLEFSAASLLASISSIEAFPFRVQTEERRWSAMTRSDGHACVCVHSTRNVSARRNSGVEARGLHVVGFALVGVAEKEWCFSRKLYALFSSSLCACASNCVRARQWPCLRHFFDLSLTALLLLHPNADAGLSSAHPIVGGFY